MSSPKVWKILKWCSVPFLVVGLLWLVGLFAYQPISLLLLLPLSALCYTQRKRCSLIVMLWLGVIAGILFYLCLPGPRPDAWQTPWAEAPQCSLDGDVLRIRKVRDFHYRSETDYDVVYRDETYHLNDLVGVDFAECHWDGMTAVCHTMLSFSFADGRHLAVSAETRLPVGEEQNAIGGIYKRYGILYVFGTEEDLFRLRTNHRHEDLSVYPLRINPQGARKLLLHYVRLAETAEAERSPYNTVTDNCSTGLVSAFRELVPDMPRRYDLLPLHNGSFTHLLYRAGGFQTLSGESEEALRKRCYLGYDIAPDNRENYSAAVRAKINR